MIEMEIQRRLKEKYNPEGSELRKAQYRMLEMLAYIDKICQENQIAYWLDCGTLLGAARHGGFIPWDDDTDICMPVKDAKRFKAIMLEQYNDGEFVLQCRETDPGFFGPWLVLRDRKSEYLQDSNLHKARKYRGLQVDIFLVDDCVNLFLRKISSILEIRLITKPLLRFRYSKCLNMFCTLGYVILYNFVFKIFNVLGLLLSSKEYITYTYGSSFKSVHLKERMFPLTRIQFEGEDFNSPNDVDKYLTETFGDWRRIPNDDEIITHKVTIAFYDEIRIG